MKGLKFMHKPDMILVSGFLKLVFILVSLKMLGKGQPHEFKFNSKPGLMLNLAVLLGAFKKIVKK